MKERGFGAQYDFIDPVSRLRVHFQVAIRRSALCPVSRRCRGSLEQLSNLHVTSRGWTNVCRRTYVAETCEECVAALPAARDPMLRTRAVAQVGRINRGGFRKGFASIFRRLSSAFWDYGEARTFRPLGNGSDQCAGSHSAGSKAAICDCLSGILFRSY